jgi:hypothetical protein
VIDHCAAIRTALHFVTALRSLTRSAPSPRRDPHFSRFYNFSKVPLLLGMTPIRIRIRIGPCHLSGVGLTTAFTHRFDVDLAQTVLSESIRQDSIGVAFPENERREAQDIGRSSSGARPKVRE